MRSAPSEIDLAPKVADTIDLGRLGRGETTGSHDVVAAGYSRAIVGREQPAFRRLIPGRRRNPFIKADVASQVIAVGDKAEIAEDFGLRCIPFRPGPRFFLIPDRTCSCNR